MKKKSKIKARFLCQKANWRNSAAGRGLNNIFINYIYIKKEAGIFFFSFQ